MLVTYPALFYYDDTDGTEATYFVHFPDFEYSATQGEGGFLRLWLWGRSG